MMIQQMMKIMNQPPQMILTKMSQSLRYKKENGNGGENETDQSNEKHKWVHCQLGKRQKKSRQIKEKVGHKIKTRSQVRRKVQLIRISIRH